MKQVSNRKILKSIIGDGLPRTAVFNEDHKIVEAQFSYDAMHDMVKNGKELLITTLKALGFKPDLCTTYPMTKIDDSKDRVTTIVQLLPWEIEDISVV